MWCTPISSSLLFEFNEKMKEQLSLLGVRGEEKLTRTAEPQAGGDNEMPHTSRAQLSDLFSQIVIFKY